MGRRVADTLSETPVASNELPRRSPDAFSNIHQLFDKAEDFLMLVSIF